MRDTHRTASVVAASAGICATVLFAVHALADHPIGGTCPLVPPGTAEAWGETFDDKYITQWPGNNDNISVQAGGLHLDEDDWTVGNFGWNDATNLGSHMARLMNAAWIVRIVQRYSGEDGYGVTFPPVLYPSLLLFQQVSIAELPIGGMWWNFVIHASDNEWVPSCQDGPGTGLAKTYGGIDEHVALHVPGARQAAATRSSTVVHETVHEDVGHIDADECSPPTLSCDTAYGWYNANTLQLNYLLDAHVMFETTNVNGSNVRTVWSAGDVCGYNDAFALWERTQLMTRAITVSGRFAVPSNEQSAFQASTAKTVHSIWICEHCELEDYTFDVATCNVGTRACNEDMNVANVQVNQARRDLCEIYNTTIESDGTSEATVSQAKAALESGLLQHSCLTQTADSARSYCEEQKASADRVDELDQCGWLDEFYLPTIDKLTCVQEYCEEKYQSDPWPAGTDPYGCLDYMCGGGVCEGDTDQQQCIDDFHMAHGDPDYYLVQCTGTKCKRLLLECLRDHYEGGTWEYPDPTPACVAYQTCQLQEQLASIVWIEYQRPWLEPGPQRERFRWLLGSRWAKDVIAHLDSMGAALSAGDMARFEAVREHLFRSPEMTSTMFHGMPGVFTWLFGVEGRNGILGPESTRTRPVAVPREQLSPRGQEALDKLRALR